MQAVNARRAARRGLLLAAVAVLAVAGPGYAYTGTSKDSSQTSGGNDHGTLTAGAGAVHITYPSGSPGGSSHAIAAVDANWTPPACWVGPIADPKTFKKQVLASVKATDVPGQANYAMEAMEEYSRHFTENMTWDGSGKGYKDFNLDQQGKGLFWGPVENPNAPNSLAKYACNGTIPFFVPNGKTPPAGTPDVITPEMLSKIAFAHTRVPGVTIETNPVDVQTVNLPTWIRLQENYAPVSVRASVDIGGGAQIWAQTTATATNVHIDPGTSDATVYPASGDCAIGKDGKVGADYDGNAKADPPCGVTYRRSTEGTGPFQLGVTATWKVTWTASTGCTCAKLPDGRVHQGTAMTVQEIQSVNR